MRTITIALIVSLFTLTGSGAWAQEPDAWRRVAESTPLGTKVKIQTIDGKRISGTLMRVDAREVTIKRSTRLAGPSTAIAFERISNLERDHGGINIGKAIGIGVATGAGMMLTMLFFALQLD